MTVTAAFWAAAAGFHLVVGGAALWLGHRWILRLAGRRRPTWLWVLQLLADGFVLSWVAGLAGVCAALFVPHAVFTLARYLGQALFLEAPLLALWVGWAHARHGERRRAVLPLAVALGLLGLYVDAYHVEPQRLEVRRYGLTLGSGTRSLRIVHLSDLQTHRIGDHERRALRAAAAAAPDLIVFTGDYIQPLMDSEPEEAWGDLAALLRDRPLRAKYGVFAVGGDVEGEGDYWREVLSGAGITCLADQSRRLALPGGTVTLIGLSNENSRTRNAAKAAAVITAAPPADLRLLLGHKPDCVLGLSPAADVDLVLAGHTHGGQIVLPFLGPPVTFSRVPRRYASGGLHRYRGRWLHVSRGIGMERITAPQARFLCPPEVSIIDVRW